MDVMSELGRLLKMKTCLVGVGNYLKNDDALGLYIIDEIEKHVSCDHITLMNVEDVIESYVFRIAGLDCENVILIDAVQSGHTAGSVIFGKLDDFQSLADNFSTHKLSLKMSGKILQKQGKNVYLLGVVPEDIEFGNEISPEIKKSADILKDFIIDSLNCKLKEKVYGC